MRRTPKPRATRKRKVGGLKVRATQPARREPHDRKGGDEPRRLQLKFRVRPLVRMPKSVMFAKVLEAVHSGDVPADLEIAYMEYARGHGRRLTPGARLTMDEQDELERFYNVLTSIDSRNVDVTRRGRVRVERPDE